MKGFDSVVGGLKYRELKARVFGQQQHTIIFYTASVWMVRWLVGESLRELGAQLMASTASQVDAWLARSYMSGQPKIEIITATCNQGK